MGKMVEEEKDCCHRHTCIIDLGRGTPFSLAWLVWQTEILVNVDWHGSYRKRVQERLYSILFKQMNSRVRFSCLMKRVGAAGLTCTDPYGTGTT